MIWTTRQRSRFGALSAITGGSGPAVLLVHGVGLRAEAWGGQLQELTQTCRVIAVDMPGHGESCRLTDHPSLADFTDAIAAILTEPAVVVGHSFGAMIALDMAIRYPDLVQGVAALNGIFQRNQTAKKAVLARAACLDGKTTADPKATLERWFGTTRSAARDACHTWLCAVDPMGYRDAYGVFAHEDGPSGQALGHLQCPALFLTGEDEPNSTPQMSKQMAALAPKGTSVVLQGAAHMLPMTHAAQVTAILKAFIQDARNDTN